jgi:hypothetical protein
MIIYAQQLWRFIPGDSLRLSRYLSERRVLLTIQPTIQGAVNQLQATETDRHITFIVDMACHGSRSILYEVTLNQMFQSLTVQTMAVQKPMSGNPRH